MTRIMLQTKADIQKIKRLTATDHSYISVNDPDNFTLLTDNRCEDEKFSRVDKFSVNHYYMIGTEWLNEKIFYPSGYGLEEINKERKHPFKKRYNTLMEDGIGLWGDRPIPIINKPIKRMELKCKPKRMTLSCVDE